MITYLATALPAPEGLETDLWAMFHFVPLSVWSRVVRLSLSLAEHSVLTQRRPLLTERAARITLHEPPL